MSKLLKTYIPSLCISFTMIILFATFFNLFHKFYKNGFLLFIIEVFIYLVVVMFVDYFISFINFKSYKSYFIIEVILLYPITIGAFVFGNWFSIDWFHIVMNSIIYLIGISLIHSYFYFLAKKQANEINLLIQSNRNE